MSSKKAAAPAVAPGTRAQGSQAPEGRQRLPGRGPRDAFHGGDHRGRTYDREPCQGGPPYQAEDRKDQAQDEEPHYEECTTTRGKERRMHTGMGKILSLDHGVGHPLLLLYDVKAPNGQKSNEFKDLDHYPSDAPLGTF
jgi:hypothetical protein